MRPIKKYVPLILAILVSFLISSFMISEVFIAQSPRINPYFVSNIKEKAITAVMGKVGTFVAFLQNKPYRPSGETIEEEASRKGAVAKILEKGLKPVAKGIHAASSENNSYTEYTLNDVEWVVIEFTDSDGNVHKFEIPKGIEYLYR